MNILPSIWYSDVTREWFMEPSDFQATQVWLASREDLIHVTNAYEVLPKAFIAKLWDARDKGIGSRRQENSSGLGA